jgi:cytochrome c oxidase subunit 2
MWNFPLFPEQASSTASRVDAVFIYELAVVLFFTAFICLLIVSFAVRYRRGTRVNRVHPPTHGVVVESLWIGIPLVISLSMFVIGTFVFYDQYEAPGDASRIDVVGKQWMWYLQHPEGKREINELHLPVGRPVQLKMISQDVIHSFFVPAFRTKQDVLPGRETTTWFHPTKVGKYHLFCAEYCGTNHSQMVGWVYVMEQADYDRWLAGEYSGPTMAKQGEELFVRHHCAGCHGSSPIVRAPRLEGVYGRPVPVTEGESKEVHFVTADDRYIRDSILLPKQQVVAGYEPVMPSFKDQIPEEDLFKIIAYIKSIGTKGPDR